MKPTVAEVESDASEKLAVSEPVVVPYRDLEAPVGELVEADGLPGDGVLPLGVEGAAAHGRLLLARLAPLGKEVTGGKLGEMLKRRRLSSSSGDRIFNKVTEEASAPRDSERKEGARE